MHAPSSSTAGHRRPSSAGQDPRGGLAAAAGARRIAAYSLIELIGALAILTILSLALVPPALQAHDRTARQRESQALESLADGFRQFALRSQTIPGPTNFATGLATELGWQLSDVLTNDRRLRRVYYLDPGITNTLPIPFTQGAFGITNDIGTNLRLMFFSSVGEPLPSAITNGFAASAAAFSNVWNVAEGQIPAGWTWSGRGDDLRIQRVNLDSLFVPVILNYDTYTIGLTNQGRFSINASTTNVLPVTPSYVAHFLRGSLLGLHHHLGTTNTLQSTEIIQHPTSFVYESDAWRGQLFLGRGMRLTTGMDLQAAHDLFIAAPSNLNAKGSPPAGPPTIINAMSNYMAHYIAWRDAGYPASHSDLDDAQRDLENLTTDLIFKP